MKSLGKSAKKLFFNNHVFYVLRNVYEPAEDTILLAGNLAVNRNDVVLDMGTGCGILGTLAAKKARKVVAVDINPYAIRCAKLNAKLNDVVDKMDIRQGDLFEPIKKTERFSIIIFNAPYLPTEAGEQKTWVGKAWAGGPNGRRIIDRFILQAPDYLKRDGRLLLVGSTLSSVDETIRELEEKGMQVRVLVERKVAFETIIVIQAKRTAL
ncbi:MAG: putative S-adenosylmethionine-dependent methyltransferase [Candidatus Bathyarchaeota archaeon BA1]|nr:MAG: putative S-adenosylmethionine-dependent methyltransferase [Candidatus Bathyarchaeota archaeon BA1]